MISPPTRLGPDRPLRVHVVGHSASFMVEPQHGPRDLGSYGEQLVPVLGDRGIPTVTSHTGTWFGTVNKVIPHWERIRDQFPDVLVVHFAGVECQSNVVPSWFIRHTSTWNRTSRFGAGWYRRRIMPRIWNAGRKLQRWTSAHDPGLTHRLSPRRFETDMRRVIDLARKECGALVLLIDVDPAGARFEHWLPGQNRRGARYQEILRRIADSYDDAVRLVPAGAQIVDVEKQLPDGMHRSLEAHTLLAELLADEITNWLKSA